MRSIPLIVILISLLSLPFSPAADWEERVLFVGNSYSFHVPKVFTKLADAKGQQVTVEQVTIGGWILKKHAESEVTWKKISGSEWDFVVLQEQSRIPSFSRSQVQERMAEPAKRLADLAREFGAKVAFFEAWGRRDGDRKRQKVAGKVD